MKETVKKKLYIVGAGSVGLHIAANIDAYSDGRYELCGFFDDDEQKHGLSYFGVKVLGDLKHIMALEAASVVIGIAFPKIKKKIISHLTKNSKFEYPSLVHPRAWLSPDVIPGRGTIIYPGTSVNYGSRLGDFCVLNMNCALGHHTKVGKFTSFAPGVLTGGHTTIGDCVDMGIGSATLQGIKIEKDAVIGGQCMVITDIKEATRTVGVPGKEINKYVN